MRVHPTFFDLATPLTIERSVPRSSSWPCACSLRTVAVSTLAQDRLTDELLHSKHHLRSIPVADDRHVLNVEIGLVLKKIIQVVRRRPTILRKQASK